MSGSRRPPNILVAISDDQSWPHAGAYGCRFVNTPAFDRVASEGVLFSNAFCPAPSCSPSRAGLLTGRNPWQIGEGGVLFSRLPAEYEVYPDLLERAGYHVGYPCRCIRTDDYVYIRNLLPDRWPAGDPPSYGDADHSPTKVAMMANRDSEQGRELFERAFGKRPEEELFAVSDGYACLNNVATDPGHTGALSRLREQSDRELTAQGDPRMCGGGEVFENAPYYSRMTDSRGRDAFVGLEALRRDGLL